jgi:hypothetical protein
MEIIVGEPVTDAEGVSYPLHTTTNLPQYSSAKRGPAGSIATLRRYTDFEYLHAHLTTKVRYSRRLPPAPCASRLRPALEQV